MSTTLTKPKPKQKKNQYLPHKPNYITILPPGVLIEEKMGEMGIDTIELARQMEVPIETIEQLFRFEIPLTREIAEKVEKVTRMPADVMMRRETRWREKFAYAMEHPEIPAYLGEEIVNQPKKEKRVRNQKLTETQS